MAAPFLGESDINFQIRVAKEEREYQEQLNRGSGGGGGGGGGGCALVIGAVVAFSFMGWLARSILLPIVETIQAWGVGDAMGFTLFGLAVLAIAFVSNKLGGALLFTIGFGLQAVGCPTSLNMASNGKGVTWALFVGSLALMVGGFRLMRSGYWIVGQKRSAPARAR